MKGEGMRVRQPLRCQRGISHLPMRLRQDTRVVRPPHQLRPQGGCCKGGPPTSPPAGGPRPSAPEKPRSTGRLSGPSCTWR